MILFIGCDYNLTMMVDQKVYLVFVDFDYNLTMMKKWIVCPKEELERTQIPDPDFC